MNLTIATTGARTFGIVKRHYLTALTVATLAIAAAIGAGIFAADDSGEPARPAAASTAGGRFSSPAAETMIFFLVESEEQGELLTTNLSMDLIGTASTLGPHRILVAGTPQEELSARDAIAEGGPWYMLDGGGYKVIDLRGR